MAEDKAREEHAIALELKYEQEMEDAIIRQQKLMSDKYAAEQAIMKKREDKRLAKEAKRAE